MTHTALTRISTCLLLAAGLALLGGCQSGDKAAPASGDPTLYGQSVPDKFAVPKPTQPGAPVKVKQEESLVFTFDVEGKPGYKPVALVTLQLKTDPTTSPFKGGQNEYTMANVPIGEGYRIEVPIAANAATGRYKVTASLRPYDTVSPGPPSVQSFTMEVEVKNAAATPGSTPGN